METKLPKSIYYLRILETMQEMIVVEDLQKIVWPGNDTDVVPAHFLITAAHNGGLVIGAFRADNPDVQFESKKQSIELIDRENAGESDDLVGFVFSFPGTYPTPDGPRIKHCSHMLAVHPEVRDLGIGFTLKRAQWQMVRHQGIDRITWTYDPLQSRNGYLNIARLGAVCITYLREAYGEMRDDLNFGLPSDRFQVDWWVNSQRVVKRLGRRPRLPLDLAHFLAAGAHILNPSVIRPDGLPAPADLNYFEQSLKDRSSKPLCLVEIPSEFQVLRKTDMGLAFAWRLHTRQIFERLFESGFWVTDFIHLPGSFGRSFYVLSYGEGTL